MTANIKNNKHSPHTKIERVIIMFTNISIKDQIEENNKNSNISSPMVLLDKKGNKFIKLDTFCQNMFMIKLDYISSFKGKLYRWFVWNI